MAFLAEHGRPASKEEEESASPISPRHVHGKARGKRVVLSAERHELPLYQAPRERWTRQSTERSLRAYLDGADVPPGIQLMETFTQAAEPAVAEPAASEPASVGELASIGSHPSTVEPEGTQEVTAPAQSLPKRVMRQNSFTRVRAKTSEALERARAASRRSSNTLREVSAQVRVAMSSNVTTRESTASVPVSPVPTTFHPAFHGPIDGDGAAAPTAPADADGVLYDALRNVGVGESVVGTLQTLGLGRGVLLTTGAADLMGLTGCAPDEASTILMVAERLPAATAATSAAASVPAAPVSTAADPVAAPTASILPPLTARHSPVDERSARARDILERTGVAPSRLNVLFPGSALHNDTATAASPLPSAPMAVNSLDSVLFATQMLPSERPPLRDPHATTMPALSSPGVDSARVLVDVELGANPPDLHPEHVCTTVSSSSPEVAAAEVAISIHQPLDGGVTVTVAGPLGAAISNRVGGGIVVTNVDAGGAAEAAGVELFMHVLSFNGINTTKMVKNEVMGLARVAQGATTWVFAAEGTAAFDEAYKAEEAGAASVEAAEL